MNLIMKLNYENDFNCGNFAYYGSIMPDAFSSLLCPNYAIISLGMAILEIMGNFKKFITIADTQVVSLCT